MTVPSDPRKLRRSLRELCDAVLLHLQALDAEMRQPADVERGRRIAALANRLELSLDLARYGGLGIDFRKDPAAKARETERAKGKPA